MNWKQRALVLEEQNKKLIQMVEELASSNATYPSIPKSDRIDWRAVDWDKSNAELIVELGLNTYERGIVSTMRHTFGHPKLGSKKTRHIKWRELDWAKNDGQLSGELGVTIGLIRQMRYKLGAPLSPNAVPGPNSKSYRIVSKEMIAAVPDWSKVRDVQLAKQWRVSRERVRQIRLQYRFPVCQLEYAPKVATMHAQVIEWVKANEATIKGKLASEVVKQMPFKDTMFRNGIYRAMKETGVPFVWRKARQSIADELDINWELPNPVIAACWNTKAHWVPINRNRMNKQPDQWSGRYGTRGRNRRFRHLDELKYKVRVEVEKAVRRGVTPQFERLKQLGVYEYEHQQTTTGVEVVGVAAAGIANPIQPTGGLHEETKQGADIQPESLWD